MNMDNNKLNQAFAALANTTRRAILARLTEGEATVNELAEPFNMSLPAISKHIKVLERAGLISQEKKAQYRPCTIDVMPLKEIFEWTEQYRHIWQARFDQMDDYINQINNKEKKMSNSTISKDAIVIERTFDAPVNLVWQMWTQPEHFKNWYGPEGFTVPVAEMDVRVGGKHLFCMEKQTSDGSMKMWSAGEYTKVVLNEHLVYTDSPADENGNVVSPFADEVNDNKQPTKTEVSVLLEDLNGRTKMIVTHSGLPMSKQEANKGAGKGWEQSFAKMADHIQAVLNQESP